MNSDKVLFEVVRKYLGVLRYCKVNDESTVMFGGVS